MLENYSRKKVSRKENHLRWNYEIPQDRETVLYHFVVLGDRNYRDSRLKDIFGNLREYGGLEITRPSFDSCSTEGRKYSFRSIETNICPDFLKIDKVEPDEKRRIRDENLRERHGRGSSIEDYVASIYNSKKS